MTAVSILIPTFRRPESFRRAVASALAQDYAGTFEIVAVDNDPSGSALGLCAALAAAHPARFRYVHEAAPGVANARNAGLRLARGALIAFLDDDEEAPAHWLSALMETHARFDADVVWGPVTAKADAHGACAEVAEKLYARTGPPTSQRLGRFYGVGNSLVRRAALLSGDSPFDVAANETGGEDDLLFAPALHRGAAFVWCAEAGVIEHVPAARARAAHLAKRAFAYGQGPCETAAAQRRPLTILRHMAVGAAQAGLWSLLALASRDDAVRLTRALKAVAGLGKIFWFCKQRFYGAASLRVAPRASHRSSQVTVWSASL